MTQNWLSLGIVVGYLVITSLVGFWQSRHVKKASDFTVSKFSAWSAAMVLAAFTLGGGGTYGVAGDTLKFGLTYLCWYPLSVSLGWLLTGLLFTRPYYRLGGITVPTLLKRRFDHRTRMASSAASLLYAIFVIVLEIYTLAVIIRALLPNLTLGQATFFSTLIGVASVAFSGILGATSVNVIHFGTIIVAFSLALATLWRTVGGWGVAIDQVLAILPSVARPGVNQQIWLSINGFGIGTIGQLLMGKAARMGGVSVVSNISASCKSEKEAVKAFLLASIGAGIPPLLSAMIGVFTAAYLGPMVKDLPEYSWIGMGVAQIQPVIGGLMMAAAAAAILAALGPTLILFSSVLVEDVIKRAFLPTDRQERILHSASIIIISVACAVFVALFGVKDILPFLYLTAFPTTMPITIVTFFGLYSKKVSKAFAFWAIMFSVPAALIWGLVLKNPWGIHNLYIALFAPLLIMSAGVLYGRWTSAAVEMLPVVSNPTSKSLHKE